MPSPARTDGFPHLAIAVYLLDAFVIGQGALAILSSTVAVLGLVPAVVLHLRGGGDLVHAARRAAAYVLAAVATLGTMSLHARIAHAHAETVVTAIERYRVERGAYPPDLEALVPGFLPAIPRAKYTVMFGELGYLRPSRANDETPSLWYVAIPPFGRPTYSFERKAWIYID